MATITTPRRNTKKHLWIPYT